MDRVVCPSRGRKTGQLALLGGQAPGVEVQVELELINDELLEAQHAAIGLQLVDVLEPRWSFQAQTRGT